jgi:hypothetical protein
MKALITLLLLVLTIQCALSKIPLPSPAQVGYQPQRYDAVFILLQNGDKHVSTKQYTCSVNEIKEVDEKMLESNPSAKIAKLKIELPKTQQLIKYEFYERMPPIQEGEEFYKAYFNGTITDAFVASYEDSTYHNGIFYYNDTNGALLTGRLGFVGHTNKKSIKSIISFRVNDPSINDFEPLTYLCVERKKDVFSLKPF